MNVASSKLQNGWPTFPLGKLCEVNIGRTPSRDRPEYWGLGYPWLSIADMNQGRDLEITKENITDLAVSGCNCRLVPVGTVLLSFKLSIGKVGIARIPLFTNEAIAALPIRNSNKLSRDYLYWALQSIDLKCGLDRAAKGLTLNKAKLVDIEIPFPPLQEQKRIADILDRAEALRAKRRAALAQLDELRQSIFIEMFGDPVKNPKNWDMTKLWECTEFMTSGSRGWAKYYSDAGEKFIRIQNVRNGKLDFSDIQLVEPPKTAESIRTKVKDGDLLISITADLGRTAVVDEQTALEGAYINQHLALIRLNKKIVDPVFVSQYLGSEGGKRQFSSLDQKGVKSGLNFENVKSLEFYLPPLSMQKKFLSIVNKLGLIWEKQSQSLIEINNLFDALMQKAFTGELVL